MDWTKPVLGPDHSWRWSALQSSDPFVPQTAAAETARPPPFLATPQDLQWYSSVPQVRPGDLSTESIRKRRRRQGKGSTEDSARVSTNLAFAFHHIHLIF